MSAKASARSEVTDLKKRIKELEMENKKLKNGSNLTKNKNRLGFWRRLGFIFFLGLAASLLAIGNIVFWAGNTVVKQDRYVAATAPIIRDTEVQKAIANYATEQFFARIDVETTITNALPSKVSFLSPQLTEQVYSKTNSTLQSILARPEFQDRWNETMANSHERFIKFVGNYEGDGTLSINDLYQRLSERLADTKLSFLSSRQIPEKVGEVKIAEASWLPVANKIVNNIDLWRNLALLLSLSSLIAAAWLSKRIRRTIYTFCFVVFWLMIFSILAQRIAVQSVVNSAPGAYQAAYTNALGIYFSSFTNQTLTIAVAVIVLGVVTWITGSSARARKTKDTFRSLFSGSLHDKLLGTRSNKVIDWLQSNKRVAEWAVLTIMTLLLFFRRVTFTSLILYIIGLVIIIVLIEVIGGQEPQKREL